MKKKFIILILMFMSLPFLFGSTSYNYSYHGEAIHSSPGMNFASYLNPQILGVSYADPKDFVVYEDHIYMIARDASPGGANTMIIVMDENFEVVRTVKQFGLTPEYEQYVQSRVSDTIELINEFFDDFFLDKEFYPGQKLPMTTTDPFINVAKLAWTSSNVNFITNAGVTSNGSEEVQTVTVSVQVSLWAEVQTFEYEVNISAPVVGLEAGSADNTPWTVAEDFSVEQFNEIVGSDFNDLSYETFREIIEVNRNEDVTIREFILDGYKFTFQEETVEDEETGEEIHVFTNIVVQEVLEETGSTPTEVHGSLFQSPYVLNGSSGIEVHESGIYVADTGNNRVVKLTHDYEVVDAFYDIEDETFKEIAFQPLKITVDPSERMYVVANNVFEGILELDSDGSFNRYTGVNPIQLTPFEVLRRALMTEAQKARLDRFLPTSFTNVTLNDKNFIYATARARDESTEGMIQLINPRGIDVLKRNGYHPPMGDIVYVESLNNYVIDGPSSLIDVAVGKHGIYSVLDEKRSRIFTYDGEGNLLYINGDQGEQSDKFTKGVAVTYYGDNLMVLDASGTIVIYSPTEFGTSVNRAVELHSEGEFEEAALVWQDVLRLNTNYEIAYNGIGKYHLRVGNYKEAMENFKLGHDQYYYSKAFVAYRNEIIKDNFGLIMFGLLVIAIAVPVFLNREKIFKKGRGEK
ncbi:MAG TPA: hypothetical protein GX742_01640 [Acholeplasmataceae bacterium]|nr:hypothetical protein [Acholeplasmataceae bacterium]